MKITNGYELAKQILILSGGDIKPLVDLSPGGKELPWLEFKAALRDENGRLGEGNNDHGWLWTIIVKPSCAMANLFGGVIILGIKEDILDWPPEYIGLKNSDDKKFLQSTGEKSGMEEFIRDIAFRIRRDTFNTNIRDKKKPVVISKQYDITTNNFMFNHVEIAPGYYKEKANSVVLFFVKPCDIDNDVTVRSFPSFRFPLNQADGDPGNNNRNNQPVGKPLEEILVRDRIEIGNTISFSINRRNEHHTIRNSAVSFFSHQLLALYCKYLSKRLSLDVPTVPTSVPINLVHEDDRFEENFMDAGIVLGLERYGAIDLVANECGECIYTIVTRAETALTDTLLNFEKRSVLNLTPRIWFQIDMPGKKPNGPFTIAGISECIANGDDRSSLLATIHNDGEPSIGLVLNVDSESGKSAGVSWCKQLASKVQEINGRIIVSFTGSKHIALRNEMFSSLTTDLKDKKISLPINRWEIPSSLRFKNRGPLQTKNAFDDLFSEDPQNIIKTDFGVEIVRWFKERHRELPESQSNDVKAKIPILYDLIREHRGNTAVKNGAGIPEIKAVANDIMTIAENEPDKAGIFEEMLYLIVVYFPEDLYGFVQELGVGSDMQTALIKGYREKWIGLPELQKMADANMLSEDTSNLLKYLQGNRNIPQEKCNRLIKCLVQAGKDIDIVPSIWEKCKTDLSDDTTWQPFLQAPPIVSHVERLLSFSGPERSIFGLISKKNEINYPEDDIVFLRHGRKLGMSDKKEKHHAC